ncbi:MAG: two-component system OmpR family response regulator, partial [Myxococcota bacterium]
GFSLVIMDLMLPGLSGAEVLTRMIAKDADVKVLVASGKDVGELAERSQVRGFIQKPFDLAQLSQKVAGVLS